MDKRRNQERPLENVLQIPAPPPPEPRPAQVQERGKRGVIVIDISGGDEGTENPFEVQ
jgi:hypothetical protein